MAGGVSSLARGLPLSLHSHGWRDQQPCQRICSFPSHSTSLAGGITSLVGGLPLSTPMAGGISSLARGLFLPLSLARPISSLARTCSSLHFHGWRLAVSLADVALSAPLTLSLWLDVLSDLAFAAPPTFPPHAADFCLCTCFSPVVEDKICQHSTESPHIQPCGHAHQYIWIHQM